MQNGIICLTFDYEIFFGSNSGSAMNCILKPTGILLDLLEQRKIKATIFVDILFYLRLLEQKEEFKLAVLVREQIQRMVRIGCRVELHLHPHWLDAIYESPNWRFPSYKNYCLESIPATEIANLFEKGTNTLNDIARTADARYSCHAFRAGGFALPPFKRICDAFRKNGIKYDSSVASGLRIEHECYSVRYPHLYKSLYRFTNDPLQEDEAGEFVEIPITTKRVKVIEKIGRKMSGQKNELASFGDGNGMRFINPLRNRLRNSYRLLSLDRGGQENLVGVLASDHQFATIVSHPKSMNIASIDIIRGWSESGVRFVDFEEASSL